MSVVMSMVLTICMLGMLAYAVRMICGNMPMSRHAGNPDFHPLYYDVINANKEYLTNRKEHVQWDTHRLYGFQPQDAA